MTREERTGVWKGVKASEGRILAGVLRCPLLASVGLTDLFCLQKPAFSFSLGGARERC